MKKKNFFEEISNLLLNIIEINQNVALRIIRLFEKNSNVILVAGLLWIAVYLTTLQLGGKLEIVKGQESQNNSLIVLTPTPQIENFKPIPTPTLILPPQIGSREIFPFFKQLFTIQNLVLISVSIFLFVSVFSIFDWYFQKVKILRDHEVYVSLKNKKNDPKNYFTERKNKKNQIDYLREFLTNMKERFEEEKDDLSARGRNNLLIGSFTAIIGIFFVYVSQVLIGKNDLAKSDGMDYFLKDFLPRVSILVVIEYFSYFFLRLYKLSLDEIKYYQNEITNIELKLLSLEYSLQNPKSDIAKDVIKILAKTERNFILKKGESTVVLENSKSEANLLKQVLSDLNSRAKSLRH